MSTALNPKRNRVYIACRACRKRKAKCISDDYADSPCERCVRKNLRCEYITVADEQSGSKTSPPPSTRPGNHRAPYPSQPPPIAQAAAQSAYGPVHPHASANLTPGASSHTYSATDHHQPQIPPAAGHGPYYPPPQGYNVPPPLAYANVNRSAASNSAVFQATSSSRPVFDPGHYTYPWTASSHPPAHPRARSLARSQQHLSVGILHYRRAEHVAAVQVNLPGRFVGGLGHKVEVTAHDGGPEDVAQYKGERVRMSGDEGFIAFGVVCAVQYELGGDILSLEDEQLSWGT
ncbi:hypothetical protein C8R46DRAFT_1278822 [Mycena filopes]|nr:hypothetical protein C8R46DRAFT_1278822 [Mycena filopes]